MMFWLTALSLLSVEVNAAALPSTLQVRDRASSGCGKTTVVRPGGWGIFDTSDDRQYRIWLPDNYDNTEITELVLSFHDAGSNIDQQLDLDLFTDSRHNIDYAVVYLEGSGPRAWGTAADISYTAEVLNLVEASFCIDTLRIYATGKGTGGGFVSQLACNPTLSTRIAAFAPVVGAYSITGLTLEAECEPATAELSCNFAPRNGGIPIMAFHGGNDTVTPYSGGFVDDVCLSSVYSWAQQWATRQGLDGTPGGGPLSGSLNGHAYGFGGGVVSLYYLGDNFPHDWPSTAENPDNVVSGVLSPLDVSAAIINFFGERVLST